MSGQSTFKRERSGFFHKTIVLKCRYTGQISGQTCQFTIYPNKGKSDWDYEKSFQKLSRSIKIAHFQNYQALENYCKKQKFPKPMDP